MKVSIKLKIGRIIERIILHTIKLMRQMLTLIFPLFFHTTQKPNGPRPQSVSSIHTNTTAPNTPTYEELQTKLEASNRNMQHIKV